MRQSSPLILAIPAIVAVVAVPSPLQWLAHAAETYDTSAFDQSPDESKQKSVVMQLDTTDGKKAEPIDPKVLKVRIDSFTALLKTARSPAEKGKFLIARSVLLLQRARMIADKSQTAEKELVPEDAAVAFGEAADNAESAMAIKTLDRKDRAYAHYLAALGYIGLNEKDKAATVLHEALKIVPDAAYSGSIVLFLGEHYYDKEQHKDAVRILKDHMAKLSVQEKAFARYRMAWCYIGLQELGLAEEMFISLIKDPNAGIAGRDAVKELAYVSVQTRNEAGVVSLGNTLFLTEPAKKAEFLSSAWSNLQRLDEGKPNSLVFTELMRMADGPDKRIQLWLEEIRANRRPYASKRHFSGLWAIHRELNGLKPEQQKVSLASTGDEILIETEQLIRSFADTYAKKVYNKERIGKKSVAEAMRALFAIHAKYFPDGKNRPAVFALWMSTCLDEQDWECAYRTARVVLTEAKLAPIAEQGHVCQIISLDQLAKADKNYQPKLVQALERYTSKEDNARWVEFSKLLTDIYAKSNNFDKAIPLLEKLNAREADEGSFHRLQMARFLGGRYKDVIKAQPPANVEVKEQLLDLVRESSLKLAQESQGAGEGFGEFESNIERFLTLNKDKNKEAIVLGDYIKKLVDRGQLEKAATKIGEMPPQKRGSSDFGPLTSMVSIRLLRKGQFKEANALVTNGGRPISAKHQYDSVLARLGSNQTIGLKELDELKKDKRDYVLGVLALSRPKAVIAYFEQKKRPDPDLKKLAYLALQIQSQRTDPELSEAMKKQLKGLDVIEASGLSAVEKMAAKIEFPSKGAPPERATAILQKAIPKVRDSRKLVPASLKDKPPEVQARILETVAKLEERMAVSVEKSPLPKGLPENQKALYLEGLAKAAVEFREQAEDYRKAVASVEQMGKDSGLIAPERAPASTLDKWAWPDANAREGVLSHLREGNLTATLILLDLQRASGELSDDSYFKFRTGALLLLKSPAMNNYVFQELRAAGQMTLVEMWK